MGKTKYTDVQRTRVAVGKTTALIFLEAFAFYKEYTNSLYMLIGVMTSFKEQNPKLDVILGLGKKSFCFVSIFFKLKLKTHSLI